MKKRRWFSLFLSFALLLPLFSLTSADAYEDFTLDAKAGLLIEADTGEILYEKNAHQENYPASLTKVMVALLVFEAIDEGKIALTDSVTATESAFEGLSSDDYAAGWFTRYEIIESPLFIVPEDELRMQNPSYSRFTNTRTDLNDCLDAIRKDVHLSDAETSAGKEMFKVFLSLCQDYGMIEGFDCGKVDSVFDHLENCSEALTE